jgi:hypothetical protein
MNTYGIDFLGHSRFIADGNAPAAMASTEAALPSALLPLQNGERMDNVESGLHRRGRGLAWPPEAQVPVLGDARNGAGRVLLAAAMERLCQAETSWGHLENTRFSWRPDGREEIAVDAARIVANEVRPHLIPDASVGLVVPDALGIAGQSALLESVGFANLLLVPHSIAAAISWVAGLPDGARTGAAGEYAGYVTVVETGLGRWSLTRLPMKREPYGKKRRLVPAHFQKFKKTGLKTTGASVVASALDLDPCNLLRLSWERRLLMGEPESSLTRPTKASETTLDALRPLMGTHSFDEALNELSRAWNNTAIVPEYGPCLGLIVTGALSQTRYGTQSLSEHLCRHLGLHLLALPPSAAAHGAAIAARGFNTEEPTWMEKLEPLDLYYLGKDEEYGDYSGQWKNILPDALLKAGTEWRNETPIGGLKLKAGGNSVTLTIRRPGEQTTWQYREVSTSKGKTTEEDTALNVNVVARPGQGFALVRVESRAPGGFSSQLDWQKMVSAKEPAPPLLGYPERAVHLQPATRLWKDCVEPLQELLVCISGPSIGLGLNQKLRNACKPMRRAISQLQPGYLSAGAAFAIDSYRLFTPIDRSGKAPEEDGNKLLATVIRHVEKIISEGRRGEDHEWLKKLLAIQRAGCPKRLVDATLHKLTHSWEACTMVDLMVAGYCLDRPIYWKRFYKAFEIAIPETTRSNYWLKAMRDIVKFNEHALQSLHMSEAVGLFNSILRRVSQALADGRPQIAQNCFETLLFLLKFRRYDGSFLAQGSQIYTQSLSLAEFGEKQYRTKLAAMAERFKKFLERRASIRDVPVDEDED